MQAVVLSDKNLDITWANQALCQFVGKSLDELRGSSFLSFLHEPERGKLYDLLQDAAKTAARVEHETTFIGRNGTRTRILFKIDVIEDQDTGHPVFRIAQGQSRKLKREPRSPNNEQTDEMQRAYRFSNLSLVEGQRLFESLDAKLDERELYLEPSFGIEEAAKLLATNTTYVSQVVNFFTDQGFPHFINYKRLQHYIKLARSADDDERTELWAKAGFGSYHAFYRFVKASLGTTPKQLFEDQNVGG